MGAVEGPLGPFGFPGYGSLDKMIEFDPDGPGPQLPVLLGAVSNLPAQGYQTRLRAWDGASWTDTQVTTPGRVNDFLVVTHPQYRGVYFASNGSMLSTISYSVRRWDGAAVQVLANFSWSLLGFQGVVALAFHDAGSQSSLFVGGYFPSIEGVPAKNLARWDGTAWHAADAGLREGGWGVTDLETVDFDGPGPSPPQLFAAGDLPADTSARGIVWWNGSAWSNSLGVNGASDIFGFDDGSGLPSLFTSGAFSVAGNQYATNIAKRIGSGWIPVGQGLTNAVHAMVTVPDNSGALERGVYAGGAFISAGRGMAVGIARWDGEQWSPLSQGLDNHVDALIVADAGGTKSVIAGGRFTTAWPVPAQRVARWVGNSWLSMGSGFNDRVQSLGIAASSVFAGGAFTASGSTTIKHVARWNEAAWEPCGNGANGDVLALAEFDDGTGAALYAGGEFTSPGSHIARWNGTQWTPLGSGMNGPVHALAVFDLHGQPMLVAGGSFSHAGGVAAPGVAVWDGQAWAPLGDGLFGTVRVLKTYEVAGPGPVKKLLGVGGAFAVIGDPAIQNMAAWDGQRWIGFGQGVTGPIRALAPFNASPGSPSAGSLFIGGEFSGPNRWIAEWRGCSPCYANCDASSGSPLLSANDFVCFLDRFVAGDPYANCDGTSAPPVLTANDFLCFLSKYATGCP